MATLTEYIKLSGKGKDGRFTSGRALTKAQRTALLQYANSHGVSNYELADSIGGLSYYTLLRALSEHTISRKNAWRIERFLEGVNARQE